MMIIVFDGVCNFCNSWVGFVLKHDAKAVFRFSTAQSPFGRQLLAESGLSASALETILLVDGHSAYAKSDAALKIMTELGWPWSLVRMFRPVPRRLRDRAYDAFARRRYKLFGRSATCQVPAPRWRDRFIS